MDSTTLSLQIITLSCAYSSLPKYNTIVMHQSETVIFCVSFGHPDGSNWSRNHRQQYQHLLWFRRLRADQDYQQGRLDTSVSLAVTENHVVARLMVDRSCFESVHDVDLATTFARGFSCAQITRCDTPT